MPYLIFVRLANINENERVMAIDLRLHFGGIDLALGQAGGRSRRLVGNTAELVVVDQLGNRPVIAANGALGILAQFQFAESHAKSVVQQEAADQWLADSEDELHSLGSLNQSDGAGENSEHPAFGATRHQAGRRRLGVEASIARSSLIGEDGSLPLEPEDGSVDVGLAEQHASVIYKVAGGEVIGAVDDDVVIAHDFERVLTGDGGFMLVDPHEGVDVEHAIGGRVQFLAADVLSAVDDLALQVREIHNVEIDQSDPAHPGGGKV